MGKWTSAYRLMGEILRILAAADKILDRLAILLEGTKEMLNSRLSPVRTKVLGSLWPSQN